jgi:uncharacterized peroxidase-related enzyme
MTQRLTALERAAAPEGSREVLDRVEKTLGMIPNLHKTLAHAPAALRAYFAQMQALAAGVLEPRLREQIAVATAGTNGCAYCASAHTAIGKALKVPEAELRRNLSCGSETPRVEAALKFVRRLLDRRGAADDADLAAIRAAGFSDAEIVEIAAHVGMNWFTNMFNLLAKTEIDFPVVALDATAAA